jgi:hypothetical protein
MDDDAGTSPTGVFLEAIHSTLAGENVRLHTDSRARVHAIAAVHLVGWRVQLRAHKLAAHSSYPSTNCGSCVQKVAI